MSGDKKAKPTAADKAAARRLHALWSRIPKARRPTQDAMGHQMAATLGKGSQSVVSQYMTGVIPLNLKAVLFFASQIGCAPTEIRDDLPGIATAQPIAFHGVMEPRPCVKPSPAELEQEWNSYPLELKQQIVLALRLAANRGMRS